MLRRFCLPTLAVLVSALPAFGQAIQDRVYYRDRAQDGKLVMLEGITKESASNVIVSSPAPENKVKATISATDLVRIDYGTRLESRLITFDDQLEFVHVNRTRAFSQGGDSGSLILEETSRRPYALLYGGGPDAEGVDRTLGHFLPSVLRQLRVRMVAP